MTWDKMQLKHRKMLTQNPGTTNFQNWKDPEDHPGLLKASSTYRPAHTGPNMENMSDTAHHQVHHGAGMRAEHRPMGLQAEDRERRRTQATSQGPALCLGRMVTDQTG